jgi:hypothetical protein
LQSNAGNAVRIGDGCATVSDYKLPTATVRSALGTDGKAGVRFEIRSQDIRLTALVGRLRKRPALLRKEKDEASLPNCLRQDSLNAFIPRFCVSEGVFVFRLVLVLVLVLD